MSHAFWFHCFLFTFVVSGRRALREKSIGDAFSAGISLILAVAECFAMYGFISFPQRGLEP